MVGYLVVQWAASTVERLVGWKVEKKAVNLVEKKVVMWEGYWAAM